MEKCPLCGALKAEDGSYRFSYRPNTPVSKNMVYTRVCWQAQQVRRRREEAGETDLPVVETQTCINTTGEYKKQYRWIANPMDQP